MSMLDDAYEIHVPMQTNEDGYSNYKWAVTAPEETPIRDNLWLMIPEYISWKVKNGFTTEKEKIDFLRYWDISDTIYRQILTSSELDVINYLYTNPLILYELITPHIKYILERFNPVIKEDIDFIMQTTFGERISHDENGRYIIAGGVSYSEFETLFNSSPSQRFNESHPYPKFTRNEISEAEELTEEMMESKSLYDKYDALAQKEIKTESDTNFIKTFDLQITGLLNITYKLIFIDMLSSYYCNIEEYKRKTLDLIYYKIINGIGLPQKVYDNINVYNIIKIIRHYPFDIIQQGIHNHDSIIWIIADRSSKATEEERFIEGVDYYLNYLDKFDHLAHLLSYWQARYQIPKHNILRALREMYTDIEKTDGKPSHHFTKDDNITRVLEEIHFSGLFELVPKHRS